MMVCNWGETAVLQLQLHQVREKLIRKSYVASMGPLTLRHFCIIPIFTMVEEILENPQLHLWWFMVRWSSWRRMNFWPWNIKLCCWYSVWLVLCDVWRWSSTEIIELSRNLWVCRYLYIKTSLAIIICLQEADYKSLRREAFSCQLGWHRLSAWKKQITKALEERLLVAIWGDTDYLLESRFHRP